VKFGVWTYCVEWRSGGKLWSNFSSESSVRLYLSRPCQNTVQYPAVQVGATRKSGDTDGWSVLRSLSQYPPHTYVCSLHFKSSKKVKDIPTIFPWTSLLLLKENPLSFALLSSQPPKLKGEDSTKELQSYTESFTKLQDYLQLEKHLQPSMKELE
jgi:hypothetical protein